MKLANIMIGTPMKLFRVTTNLGSYTQISEAILAGPNEDYVRHLFPASRDIRENPEDEPWMSNSNPLWTYRPEGWTEEEASSLTLEYETPENLEIEEIPFPTLPGCLLFSYVDG